MNLFLSHCRNYFKYDSFEETSQSIICRKNKAVAGDELNFGIIQNILYCNNNPLKT